MLRESTFKVAVFILWLPFLFIRVYYLLKKGGIDHSHFSGKERRESGKDRFALFLVIVLLYAGGFAYVACDRCVPWLSFRLPFYLRFLGMAFAFLGLALLNWAHRHLQLNWSYSFRVGEEHQLIQTGPYRHIRHPMYAAVFIYVGSLSCVSANLLILVPSAMMVLFFLRRISREEAVLMEFFGDCYLHYRQETGALLPRLRRRQERRQ